MKRIIYTYLLLCVSLLCNAQFKINEQGRPEITVAGKTVLSTPEEGLWAVASGWTDNWPSDWRYANPDSTVRSGKWTVVYGSMPFPDGKMLLRDSYCVRSDGLVQCIRRYEWFGKETLRNITLSVRLRMQGGDLKPFMPGILYYGNKMGAKVNAEIIPVYEGNPGEFAIFEDHRYAMPFVMLEDAPKQRAVSVHVTPSLVRGAVLQDQWWSFGIETEEGYNDFVLYSGPIGYNRKHSIAKALQREPMRYADTYINMEPGQVIEKEFFIESYAITEEGSGFQRPVYTSLDLYKPYNVEQYPSFDCSVEGKYRQAKLRWTEKENVKGFNMYDPAFRRAIVMGWCGQADSPGYALQVLEKRINDPEIPYMVQQSLDFLTTFPMLDGGVFRTEYDIDEKNYNGGDHVSCGQAMYNLAKAIENGRKSKKYDTLKWEEFLRKTADAQSRRILDELWNPHSTAEAFYIAPLIMASKLFKQERYRKAAEKTSNLYAERHCNMTLGCYWGGTLDATCEDKEGAWAAFQGFLEMYERIGEQKYLKWAKHAMDVCLSYVVVWDIPLPAGRMADHRFKTTGWSVVSPQNQHIDVYGVLFAPEVYKMGNYLKDERLKKLAKVMYRSCYQLVDAFGSQGEQLSHTNFAQYGDMSNVHKLRGSYSEGWTVFWVTAHFLNAAARFIEMGVNP